MIILSNIVLYIRFIYYYKHHIFYVLDDKIMNNTTLKYKHLIIIGYKNNRFLLKYVLFYISYFLMVFRMFYITTLFITLQNDMFLMCFGRLYYNTMLYCNSIK